MRLMIGLFCAGAGFTAGLYAEGRSADERVAKAVREARETRAVAAEARVLHSRAVQLHQEATALLLDAKAVADAGRREEVAPPRLIPPQSLPTSPTKD